MIAYAKLTSATLALCLAAAPAMAQDAPEQEKRVRRATRQMWLGSGLMAAGALVAPITGTSGRRDKPNTTLVGLGMIAVGTLVLWTGAQNRRKALRPNTSVHLQLGRTTAVQLQRAW